MFEPTLHIVLHQPEIPINAGVAFCTCVALGANPLVRPFPFQLTTAMFAAGLDYWEHLTGKPSTTGSCCPRLPSHRVCFSAKRPRCFTRMSNISQAMYWFSAPNRKAFRVPLEAFPDRSLRIPTGRKCEASICQGIGIVAYEAVRQWRQKPEGPGAGYEAPAE